jgi:hypothetical protein
MTFFVAGIRRKHQSLPANLDFVEIPPDSPREHWSTNTKGARVLSISNVDRQNLRQHRDALEEQMQQIEVQSQAEDVDQRNLEVEIREVRARVDMLTREMSRYMIPPSYASEHGEEN